MARPRLEVADVFRAHGAAWRKANAGHVSLAQLKGVSTLAGYADTSSHGRVRFVISLASNDGEMLFRLLRAIESELVAGV